MGWFRFRISTKVFIVLLGLTVISLVLFGYVAFRDMKELGQYALERSNSLGAYAVNDSIDALKAQAEEYLLQLAKDQAAISNALLEKVEDEVRVVVSFASSLWKSPYPSDFRRSYSQEEEPGDIYAHSVYTLAPGVNIDAVKDELDLSGKMDEIFVPIYTNDRNIDTVCMGTESGVFRSYPWRSGRDPSYDPRKRSWYKKAAGEGEMVWTEPYIHAATKELIVTCSMPFYGQKGKLKGVVEADVTLKVMNEKIMSTQIGSFGYTFLIDTKGNVIARPGLVAGDTRWDETYKTENLLKSDNARLKGLVKDMIGGKSGIAECELEGGDKYIAYAPITVTNWFLGVVMPVEEIISPALVTKKNIVSATKNTSRYINKQIKSVLKVLIIVFAAIILVVLFLDYRVSRRITKPILALNDGAKVVGSGNLSYRMNIKTGDEIEDLAGAFNKMTDDLKSYIEDLKQTTAAKERMESELKIAHDIQMSIVPKTFPPFPERKEFSVYAALIPAKEVGGDFYDFFFIDNGRLCFVIGDVSGKGVPAALFMSMTKTLIKTTAKEIKSPDGILDKVNKEISRDSNSPMFITVFCGILNTNTGEICYANGGHNPPIIIKKTKEPELVQGSSGTVVGAFESVVYKKDKLVLQNGDTIFMYTDGITEAVNERKERFSAGRLKEEVSVYSNKSVEELVNGTLKKIKSYSQGMPQSDDITVLALKYLGNAQY